MNNNDEQDGTVEVLQPSAIMAMEKAQIDIQISTAHQYPRSLELFKKRALAMATLDPDTADSCIYLRPVGKEDGKQKYAEGPSIRLAEIVAVSYGNLRAASKVVEQTERYVKCTGMAHDLESNTAMSADCIESTVTRDGKPYSERQRALIAKVCGAKALRDSIFKVVPRALCKPIMDAAKKVAAGQDKSLDERRKKAQAWIGTLKIDEKRVFAALGVSGWTDVTPDHLIILTGLKTAMSDGDETIEGAFPALEKPTKAPETTGFQQATTGTGTQSGEKAPKTAQDASKEKPAVVGHPTPANAPVASNASQSAPTPEVSTEKAPETAKTDEQAESEAGLAPQTITQGETNPPATPTAPFVRNPNDSDEVNEVKLFMHGAGIEEPQIMRWALKNKLAKEGQNHLGDLAGNKLMGIIKNWDTILPVLRAS